MSTDDRATTDGETEGAFSRLYAITRTLRGEQGCPWDKDQTALSLRRFLIEEAFETVDAMTSGDAAHVREELGDVFYNAVLIGYLYEQAGDFTIAQSLRDIGDKLIRRHPHIFARNGETPALTSGDVLRQWDDIKETVERRGDNAAEGFPPLLRATKLLKHAAKKGRATPTAAEARARLDESLQTVSASAAKAERMKRSPSDEPFTVSGGGAALDAAHLRLEADVGTALFALADYARLLGVDPSVALDRANRAFCARTTGVEDCAAGDAAV